jgi:transposase InsO family protein
MELDRWNKAPVWNQERAWVRQQILDAVQSFIKEKGYIRTHGEVVAALFYKEKKLPGVEDSVYQTEPGLSVSKIRRLRASYEKKGLPGLLVNYGGNKGKQRSISPEISIFIIATLKRSPGIRKSNIYKIIKKTFTPAPSRKTVERFINTWKDEKKQISVMIENPQEWKNKYMAAFASQSAGVDYFCHTWEIDSTKADVITADGKRRAIIALIDVYSRRAKIFIAPTSKSIAIAACIREGISSWGVPTRIRMDNGRDYQSKHILAITTSLQIDTPKLPVYTPEAKPFIESFFGTYTRGLLELLPGFCGHSVAERQSIRERETWASKIMKSDAPVEIPLSEEELKQFTGEWLELYEKSPHSGLGNRAPLEVSRESRFQPQKIRDERVLDVLLAPVSGSRIIGKKGISIEGEVYTSPEMVAYVGKRIVARFDLMNAGLIYVFDASKGTFLFKATSEPLEGQRLEEYRKEKKNHKKRITTAVKALDSLGMPGRNAVQILFEDQVIYQPLSNVVPFQGEADNEAIRESKKAVNGNIESDQDAPRERAPVIPIKSHIGDPRDNSGLTDNEQEREYERAMENHNKRASVQAGSFKE